MRINLVEVAESAAYLLAGLAGTDDWPEIRIRISVIFGDVEGGAICDASASAARTGRLAQTEELILNQLLTRVESTFELRRLMNELSIRALRERPIGDTVAMPRLR
jgi:hypothetical protein